MQNEAVGLRLFQTSLDGERSQTRTWSGYVTDVACAGSLRYVNLHSQLQDQLIKLPRSTQLVDWLVHEGYDPISSVQWLCDMCIAHRRLTSRETAVLSISQSTIIALNSNSNFDRIIFHIHSNVPSQLPSNKNRKTELLVFDCPETSLDGGSQPRVIRSYCNRWSVCRIVALCHSHSQLRTSWSTALVVQLVEWRVHEDTTRFRDPVACEHVHCWWRLTSEKQLSSASQFSSLP